MARSIERRDVLRVLALVGERLGENCTRRNAEFLTLDNWTVLVSGWHHHDAWSRGFMVGDNLRLNRGHTSPVHDGGRYEGRGWHQRMADDIVATVERMRLASVQETGATS